MKYIKTYERKITIGEDYENLQISELKKYILLNDYSNFDTFNEYGDDLKMSIYKVIDKNLDDSFYIDVEKLYEIDKDNGIVFKWTPKMGFSFDFITGHLLSQSDDLNELLNTTKMQIDSKKYNL